MTVANQIKNINIEYWMMQRLQPETTCDRNFVNISFYSNVKDGLANISDAMKNKENGHASLASTIERLLGSNNFGYITNDQFPHWFMKFATVGKGNANAFVRYLNRNLSVVENRSYHFQAINGDVTSSKEAQKYCKKVIKNNPDKIVVFISQGMATTSFSVTSIGNSVVFSDNLITADDIQALHRSATWAEGKADCNMIFVTTNDSMDHSFDDIFEDETKIATSRDEKEEIYKVLLNNNSMVHYTVDGNSVRPVVVTPQNVAKVLDKRAESMTRVASLMNVVNELDEEIRNEIFATVAGVKTVNTRSVSTKGEQFDPFGDDTEKETKKRVSNGAVSVKEQEKIMRAFVESAVLIPALAQEQGEELESTSVFSSLNLSRDLFFRVYDASPMFKDRIDTIFGLCDDVEYLVDNYIAKMAA